MHLLDHLQSYLAYDATETAHRDRVMDFLRQTPFPFHRETLEGHITGSAFVINPNSTHILLLHHRQLDRWLQPGGHCDGNPDPLAVALQEVQEETGLTVAEPNDRTLFDIDVHPIPAKGKVPAHWHYDIRYLVRADDTAELRKADREVISLQWIPIDQLSQINPEESFQRVTRKLKVFGK